MAHSLSIVLLILAVVIFSGLVNSLEDANKCFGYCTDDLLGCRGKGGQIFRYCSATAACCEVAGSCGQSMSAKTVFFKSPNYPEIVGGDRTCEFKAEVAPDTVGLRVEFINVEMDGQSFLKSLNEDGQCDSDILFLRGFSTWAPPPRCGNLTGYSTIVDVLSEDKLNKMGNLSILTVMSSPSYRWHIKITQVSGNDVEERLALREQSQTLLQPIPINPSANAVILKTAVNSVVSTEVTTSAVTESPVSTDNEGENTEDTESSDSTTQAANPTTTESEEDTDESEDGRRKKRRRESKRMKIIRNNNQQRQDVISGSDKKKSESVFPTKFPFKASFRIKSAAGNTNINGRQSISCKSDEGTHFCSGSAIGDQFILSAAHCFFGSTKTDGMVDLNSVRVIIGEDANSCNNDNGNKVQKSTPQVYEIETVSFHYGYDQNLILNDLAIVKLKKPVKTARKVSFWSIRMPYNNENQYFGRNTMTNFVSLSSNTNTNKAVITPSATILAEEQRPSSNSPQKSHDGFFVQNQTYCTARIAELYSAPIDKVLAHPKYRHAFESTLCVASKTPNSVTGAAKGDSGGPLVVADEQGKPVLIGIVSYGIAPENVNSRYDRDVDFFTSVSHYRDWIDIAMVD